MPPYESVSLELCLTSDDSMRALRAVSSATSTLRGGVHIARTVAPRSSNDGQND